MFYKPHARSSLKASVFSVRPVNPWNSLPKDVAADSLINFQSEVGGKFLRTGLSPLPVLIRNQGLFLILTSGLLISRLFN